MSTITYDYAPGTKVWAITSDETGPLTGVTAINVLLGGTGYMTPPQVVIAGGGGTGTVATAVLGSGMTAGQVVSVTIISGGSGYVTPPAIGFIGGAGTGAFAQSVIGETSAPPIGVISGIVDLVKANVFTPPNSSTINEVLYYISKLDGTIQISADTDTFGSLSDAITEYESRLS